MSKSQIKIATESMVEYMCVFMWGSPSVKTWAHRCDASLTRSQRRRAAGHGTPPLWARAGVVLLAAESVVLMIVALVLIFGTAA